MHKKGYHILLELYEVESELLDDTEGIKHLFLKAGRISKLKVIENSFLIHKFTPVGLTAVVLLETSHISIHTWPQLKFASLDIFACDSKEKVIKAANFIVKTLKPKKIKKKLLKRGFIINPG